jgi:hypothetical protein
MIGNVKFDLIDLQSFLILDTLPVRRHITPSNGFQSRGNIPIVKEPCVLICLLRFHHYRA